MLTTVSETVVMATVGIMAYTTLDKQGVALTGRNTIGPPCSVTVTVEL